MSCNDSMEFWHICFTRIRRLYANIPVVIIDDNSSRDLVENATNRKRAKDPIPSIPIEGYLKCNGTSLLCLPKESPLRKSSIFARHNILEWENSWFWCCRICQIHLVLWWSLLWWLRERKAGNRCKPWSLCIWAEMAGTADSVCKLSWITPRFP